VEKTERKVTKIVLNPKPISFRSNINDINDYIIMGVHITCYENYGF